MPDTHFDDRLARVVETRVAPGQSFVSVARLSGGASQETYRIETSGAGGERVFAMRRAPGGLPPEHAEENPGLAAEAALMRAAREAGVPEPEVYHVLEEADGLGLGFIMEWLDGEALGARIVRSPELAQVRQNLAYNCGQILGKIHGIDVNAAGVEPFLTHIEPRAFVMQMWDRYRGYDTPQPMIDYTARWLLDHLPANPRRTLVHNDFRNGNFLVDQDGIVAVLDWEVAHIGDPMRDLGWIATNSWRFGGAAPVGGFGEYADLFRGYEEVSGIEVDPEHVRFWEVFGSFWWSVGCLQFADHFRNGPDKSVERAAVGRRTSECQVDCVNLIIPGPFELAEAAFVASPDMPDTVELLTSVTQFLRGDVMAATSGRENFLARVAANTLEIVRREVELAGEHRHLELGLLNQLAGIAGDDVVTLRWTLVNALRADLPLDDPALQQYLRTSVANQVAIDQPRYSGFKTAVERK